MNRVLKRTLATLGTVFAVAATVESDGYDAFDRKDGTNPLCTIDPQCRMLTEAEINMARMALGNTVDYARVRIFNRNFLGLPLPPMAPNGHIYYHIPANAPMASINVIFRQSVIAHELTHVLQTQKGQFVVGQALWEWVRHGFNYKASYRYTLHPASRFNDYGLEQQGKIVEDYTRNRLSIADITPSETHQLWSSCAEIADLVQIMNPALPAVIPAICVPVPPQNTDAPRLGS